MGRRLQTLQSRNGAPWAPRLSKEGKPPERLSMFLVSQKTRIPYLYVYIHIVCVHVYITLYIHVLYIFNIYIYIHVHTYLGMRTIIGATLYSLYGILCPPLPLPYYSIHNINCSSPSVKLRLWQGRTAVRREGP